MTKELNLSDFEIGPKKGYMIYFTKRIWEYVQQNKGNNSISKKIRIMLINQIKQELGGKQNGFKTKKTNKNR